MARGTDGKAQSSRGRGKFKISRGGGRHFSRDIAVVDQEMENLGLGGSGESDSDESSSEEEEGARGADQPEMTRAERKAMKKAQAGKRTTKSAVGAKALPPQSEEEDESEESEEADVMLQSGPLARTGPSRKEKEAADKKAAAERYQKLHAEGKTEQAQKDMSRLAEIRKKREADAAARKAREEEEKREAEEKRQARLGGKK